jgi:ubiquinone biosynthesis O-methyltransferase
VSYKKLVKEELHTFDNQAEQRIKHGFVPDLRGLKRVDWFYNNVWRDPEFVKIHWIPRISEIINQARNNGNKVLELGCGLGMLSLELARNGLDVTGVDLSPKNIDVANEYKKKNTFKDNFGSLEYVCCDVNEMHFGKEGFDSVIFFRSLHHIPNWENLLEKVHSVLKTGGKLILSEPVRSNFTKESAHFAAILRTILPTWINYKEKLINDWNEEEWNEIVNDIFEEYVLDGEHQQSPMDNSIDDAQKIVISIKKNFSVLEEKYSDAFIDKIIGGIRGDHKYEIARFLKFLDEHMVRNNILPPTSLELVAVKEG